MSSATRAALGAARLRALLADGGFVRHVDVLATTASTNDEVRARAALGAPEGTVVVADHQTAGRGRRGRSWYSPPGMGLYVSVLLRPTEPAANVTRYTLGAAVAACRACREVAGCGVDIEWPNDLVWAGRKVAGILCELRGQQGGSGSELVVGAGFNVYQRENDWPEELRAKATSLRVAAGHSMLVEREPLAVAYLRHLGELVLRLRQGAWPAVASTWESLAPGARGRAVTVHDAAADAFHGLTAGLDAHGALRVRRDDGTIVVVRDSASLTSKG